MEVHPTYMLIVAVTFRDCVWDEGVECHSFNVIHSMNDNIVYYCTVIVMTMTMKIAYRTKKLS